MKLALLLLVLVSSTTALTSIRRLVEENVDILAQLEGIDLFCTMQMADSEEACAVASDMNAMSDCVWCPTTGGDSGGACVSSDIGTMVNAAGIPHIHCGPQPDKEQQQQDEEFFDDLNQCVTVHGTNGESCIGGSKCQWCVTKDDPTFGLCFSKAFVTEASTLIDDSSSFDALAMLDGDAAEEGWDDVFDCGTDDGVYADDASMSVGSLSDMECATNGNPEDMFADVAELCDATLDSNGNPCVVVNLFGLMDFCMTDTQMEVVDFIFDQLEDMGIDDPLALMGSLGGGGGGSELGPVLGSDKLGDFGDEEPSDEYDFMDETDPDYGVDEARPETVGYQDEDSAEGIAEDVNEEEETLVDQEEDGK